ncbi:MAG: clostripain-related cysteine peptidase [Bacteroidales bacterium]
MKGFSSNLFLYFLLSGIVFLFTGCEEDTDSDIRFPAQRTVLAYLIADNNLSDPRQDYSEMNIASMIKGMQETSGENLNLLIYQDAINRDPVLWRISVQKGKAVKIQERIYADQNSADPRVMATVIQEVFADYPATEKGLILWSHGSGWLPSPSYTLQPTAQGKAIGPDGSDWMEIWDVRKALSDTGLNFHFLIFDACHMANVEVAYELKDYTDHLIASSAEVMGAGFPYQTIIPVLDQKALDLGDVCKAYMNYYNGSNQYLGGTISCIKTERLPELARLFKDYIQNSNLTEDELRQHRIQEFGRRIDYGTTYRNIYYDLENYISLIAYKPVDEFTSFLNQVVLYKGYTPSFGFDERGGEKIEINTSCGMTLFIPELNKDVRFNHAYRRLSWFEATRDAEK